MHIVPLSPARMDLLNSLPWESELLFPALRGGQMSNMTMTALLRRVEVNATVHGFRSTFRTWSTERTAYPRKVMQQALAHTLGALEQAYNRSSLLEKRRRLMQDWQQYIETPRVSGKVHALRG